MNDHESQHGLPARRPWKLRYSVVLSGVGALGLYLLATQHQAHIVAALPYLFLLACPVMHLFMHRGHGAHRADRHDGHDQRSGHP